MRRASLEQILIPADGGFEADDAATSLRATRLRSPGELRRVALRAPCNDARAAGYSSYLNESATRVRKADTLPSSSTVRSILVTSAMRRSRSDFDAIATARLAASSQESGLTPTTSTIR